MRVFFMVFIVLAGLAPCLEAAQEGDAKASIILTEPELRASGCGQYRLVLENFPVHRQIMISTQRVLQEDPKIFTNMGTICLDEQGIIEVDKRVKVRFYGLNPADFAPGELVKYRFEDDQQRLCEVSYIPKPITASSKEGTFTMEAELLAIATTIWRLRFDGIEEEELLFLTSNSCGEILTSQDPYRSCDVYVLFPNVIGEVGGYDEVTIRRKSGDQAFLRLPWGTQIIDDLKHEQLNCLPVARPQSEPKIINGRFYMKNMAFSILLPDKFLKGTIDENARQTCSTVRLRQDCTSGDQVIIDTAQASLGTVFIENGLDLSRNGFIRWKKSILEAIPRARILHEEEWEDKQRKGYFVLMEVPAGIRLVNPLGNPVDMDVIRGYLISFVDSNLVSICVQDNVFSFKWFDEYLPLQIIKNELLNQATDLLKSYRKEGL